MSTRRDPPARVLILGGTGEAVALAGELSETPNARARVLYSLAGRTRSPVAVPCEVRTGGFGGAVGLARYLRENGIDAVVDATHPFAARISQSARLACESTGVPRLVLDRPRWRRRPGDDWREVEDVHAAARLAPRLGRRIFVTVGQGELQAFAGLTGAWLLVRLVDRPPTPLPLADHEVILARGPFSLDGEKKLLGDHRIEVLVTKASGGAATEAKLHAARALGLPVVMVRRPDPERGPRVESVAAAVEWVREQADQAQPA